MSRVEEVLWHRGHGALPPGWTGLSSSGVNGLRGFLCGPGLVTVGRGTARLAGQLLP